MVETKPMAVAVFDSAVISVTQVKTMLIHPAVEIWQEEVKGHP